MRAPSNLVPCLGLALAVGFAGTAVAQPDDSSQASMQAGGGRMIVLSDEALQRADSVTILRGSAVAPRKASTGEGYRVQLIGGRRLWLVDRETGEVVACASVPTSTVGKRIIQCTDGRLR